MGGIVELVGLVQLASLFFFLGGNRMFRLLSAGVSSVSFPLGFQTSMVVVEVVGLDGRLFCSIFIAG